MRNDLAEKLIRAAGGPAADALRLRERNEMRARRARARAARGLPPPSAKFQHSLAEDKCPPVARMTDHIRFMWYGVVRENLGRRDEGARWLERAERLIEVRRASGNRPASKGAGTIKLSTLARLAKRAAVPPPRAKREEMAESSCVDVRCGTTTP